MHVPQTDIVLRHEGAELVHVTLPPGEYTIGRNREVEIFADTPLISRRHALLTINFDHLLLEDLGSSNGTFINDQPVTEVTRLFPNQSIRLGDVQLEIRRQRALSEPGVSMAPAQATIRRLLPDELLAEKRYAIGSVVAQGGMGAILAAQQNAMRRSVAMKVMLDSAGETDIFRFIEEAQITGQLAHPNIVPVYELGVDENDQVYYTMKMVRGITLRKVLELLEQGTEATVKKYPLPALLTVFQKICDAIAFAHSKGVIHRDLKPENVMLDDFGVVLVMDWGLAKVMGNGPTPAADVARTAVLSVRGASGNIGSTQAGTIMGTPQYMSPEQARGEIETLDARSDIYALGAILFQLLYLRPPVTGRTAAEVVDKVGAGQIEWPDARTITEKRLPHLPSGRAPDSLVAVVRKAMALDKERRYQRLADFQRDLEAYQNGFATSAEKAGVVKQVALLVKRHKGIFGTACAAWLIITALIVGFVIKVTASERVASQALANLRRQAPAFAAMAETHIAQLNLPAALGKLDSAIQLDPNRAEYHARRGDVLQSLLRFAESAAAYDQARALGKQTAQLEAAHALSSRLSASAPAGKEPTAGEFSALHALLMEQQRLAEAVAIAPKLTNARDAQRRTFAARLKQMHPNTPQSDLTFMLTPTADNRYDVDLGNLEGRHEHTLEALRGVPMRSVWIPGLLSADLSPLAGQRLESLSLPGSKITNVRQLRGAPLRSLRLRDTPLTSLEGLEGCPLEDLDIINTRVSSLAPLKGAPLKILAADVTDIEDLSPLKGMPLEELHINRTKIRSIEPLRGMKLRELTFGINSSINNLEPLRGMPLERLVVSSVPISELGPLAGMPLTRLSIDSCRMIQSLTYLRDLPLEYLNIRATKATDFDVLRHLKLKGLNACHTDFVDGNVLRGQPIEVLLLSECPKLKDVSFLKNLPNLRALALPPELIPAARDLPNLRYLSTQDIALSHAPTLDDSAKYLLPVEKFWAEYDAQHGAEKK